MPLTPLAVLLLAVAVIVLASPPFGTVAILAVIAAILVVADMVRSG